MFSYSSLLVHTCYANRRSLKQTYDHCLWYNYYAHWIAVEGGLPQVHSPPVAVDMLF